MIVFEKLNKCVAWFAGGYGTAKLDNEGEEWTYTVYSARFGEDLSIVQIKATHKVFNTFVKEYGHKEGFAQAVRKMPGHETAYV